MKTNSKVNRYAKWTLILGIILTLVLPFSIPLFNLEELGKYGTVGDTIGGITSPVSQFLGSILIYLALKAQLDANMIIQDQVNEDNKQLIIRHDLEQIHELYSFFQNNIRSFSYEREIENNKIILSGKRAIKHFFEDMEEMNVNIHSDDDILKIDGVREILSTINSAKIILQKTKNSKLTEEDKEYYNTLIYHELVFSIFPAGEIESVDPLALKKCEMCEIYHGNFPPLIFLKIQELKNQL